jgi:AraC-like DNA-binding protein
MMVRFEEALAGDFRRSAHVSDVRAAIGVSERTLRMCSSKVLGIGPGRYLRLRRLNLARAKLRRADGGQVSVADVANRFGFSELGRFAATYRIAFGKTPSTTLWRPRNFVRDAASADNA